MITPTHEAAATAIQARQHAFLDAIMKLRGKPGRESNPVAIHEGFAVIDAMLDAGLDPNFRCARADLVAGASLDVSPLFVALLLEPGSCQQRLLSALIGHGANLLMDETLTELAAKKMRGQPKLANFLVAQLETMEQDRPSRTPDGGNLLHAMARHDPQLIVRWTRSDHRAFSTACQWLIQTDTHSRLPLDVAIATARRYLSEGGHLEDALVEAIYTITGAMLQHGVEAALIGRNDIGQVLDNMQNGLTTRAEVMTKLASLWCKHGLETHTPRAQGQARATRL